jgi:hypothetical protein
MDNLVRTGLNALEVAGSLSGVPYAGAAAIVLRELVECCKQVGVHKVSELSPPHISLS